MKYYQRHTEAKLQIQNYFLLWTFYSLFDG